MSMAALGNFFAWLLLYHVLLVLKTLLFNIFEASLGSFRKNFKRIAFSATVFAGLFCIEHLCLPRDDQRKCLLEFGILSAFALFEMWQKGER